MTRTIAIATALTLMCGSAFAQSTTGPANQGDTATKPGMSNGMDNSSGGMTKPSTSSTTGMSNDGSMSKDGMAKKDMSKDKMQKGGMKN